MTFCAKRKKRRRKKARRSGLGSSLLIDAKFWVV